MMRTRPLRPWLALLLLPLALLAGCATVAPVAPGPTLSPSERAKVFLPDLAEARQRSWRTALDIAAAYGQIPAGHCPGIAAFLRDFAVARRLVEEGGGEPNLDLLDVNTLVTRNPNFWRASLEIAPHDGSFLLLHATLLASAGEIWRANRVLLATTQLLPLEARTRPLYLAHVYGLGAIIMDSVAGIDDHVRGADFDRVISVYREGLAVWPRNGLLLGGVIDVALQKRFAAEKGAAPEGDRREVLIDEVLATMSVEIERLRAVDPVAAAAFHPDPEARRKGRELQRLWSRLGDSDVALGYKEVGELASALEESGAHELALVLQRLLVVARGFPTPGDFVTWRRVLPELVGGAAAAPVLAAWEGGQITSVAITGFAPDDDGWHGDPAINAILRQQIEREIAERTFRIDMLAGQDVLQARAHRERGVFFSRAGMHEEALKDFDAALRLLGRNPVVLVDKAVALGTAGREAEAEALLADVAARRDEAALATLELGVLRYGQGRYKEALERFREEARRRPEEGYPALLAELAARRLGDSERRLLERSLRRVDAASWVAACLRYLEGGLTAEELFQRAHEGGDLRVAEQLSEAHFVVAQAELAAGNLDRAIRELEACLSTGMSGMIEYRLARLELRRIAPEREARLRRDTDPAEEPRPRLPPTLEGAPADETEPRYRAPA
jgi:lipoprotein NlpI